MRKEDLFRAVGGVREEFILEAEPVRKNNAMLKKILPMAAAAVLLIGGTYFVTQKGLFSAKSTAEDAMAPVVMEEAVNETEAETFPEEEMAIAEEAPAPEADEYAYVTSPAAANEQKAAEAEAPAEAELPAAVEEAEAEIAEFDEDVEEAAMETNVAKTEYEKGEASMSDAFAFSLEERIAVLTGGTYLTVGEITEAFSNSESVSPSMVSASAIINSLDYSDVLPEKSGELYGELQVSPDGTGYLFVTVTPKEEGTCTLYIDAKNDVVSGIRFYGDEEYCEPSSEEVLLSEWLQDSETRTMLLELLISKGTVNEGEDVLTVTCELDGKKTARVLYVSLEAENLTEMSEAMRLALLGGKTAELLVRSPDGEDAAYEKLLSDVNELPASRGAEALKQLLSYLITD